MSLEKNICKKKRTRILCLEWRFRRISTMVKDGNVRSWASSKHRTTKKMTSSKQTQTTPIAYLLKSEKPRRMRLKVWPEVDPIAAVTYEKLGISIA